MGLFKLEGRTELSSGTGTPLNIALSDSVVAGEANALKNGRAYLSTMRHELRTPINAVIGYSEMLLEDVADQGLESLTPHLERIHAAGKQLLVLVNDLLEQSKVDSGLANLGSEDFRNTLGDALSPPAESVLAAGERAREAATLLDQTSMLADIDRITTAARRFLVLVEEIVNVESHDSEAVETTQRSMPADAIEEIGPMVDSGVEQSIQPGLILIVDDNEANRDMLSRRLVRQGHTVAMAENGRRALELVRKTNFDLVLLDVLMPEVNGYDVLKQLKNTEATRDIPVIMISALDELDIVVRCIEMGAEDYLPKPFNPVLLRARIGASLEKKHFRDQEVAYLRAVSQVTAGAAAMEASEFEPSSLDEVAARSDALGALGRVFQNMAREVIAREKRLREQLQELKIEIDEVKKARQVEEITDTDYFRSLQEKARRYRNLAQDRADRSSANLGALE